MVVEVGLPTALTVGSPGVIIGSGPHVRLFPNTPQLRPIDSMAEERPSCMSGRWSSHRFQPGMSTVPVQGEDFGHIAYYRHNVVEEGSNPSRAAMKSIKH